MDRRGDSLYRPVSAAELLAARTCRFDPHFFEHGGPPHGGEWKLRHWLPVDAQGRRWCERRSIGSAPAPSGYSELEDPFIELPQPSGFTSVFPAGVPWLLANDDTVPVVYIAGPAGLITAVERVCPGRVIGIELDDPAY